MTATLTRPDVDARNAFLAHFAEGRRSHVTNLFLAGPRAGMTDPAAIVAHVATSLQDHVERTHSEPTRIRETLHLQILNVFPDEALGFAAWAIAYTQQPAEDRAESKRSQQQEHVSKWLSNQPATPAQIAYVRRLGHTGDVCSKLHASQLIEHLKAQQSGGRHNG